MSACLEYFTLEGRSCAVRIPEGGPWPVACLCEGGLERLTELEADTVVLAGVEGDWERDYTPWPGPALAGRAPFTGGGREHLAFLTGAFLPYLAGHYPVKAEPASTALMGYSLGGLFALWALGQTGRFGLIASLSGSLWYEGWLQYLERPVPAEARVYLSLGKDEVRTRGPMGAIGENTRRTAELLAERLGEERVTLEWNRGGHFTGIPNRWRKALTWAAKNFQ